MYECKDQSSGSKEREWWMETSNVFKVEKGSYADLIDMMFKGEVSVESHSEVVDVWRWKQSGFVDGEAEVVRGFG